MRREYPFPKGNLHAGDAFTVLRTLPTESVQCCVTSPPYWGLRDYGLQGQLGLEGTPQEYVSRLLHVFAEVWRVLRKDGTLWLNLADSYIGYHGNRNRDYRSAPSNRGGYFENMRKTTVGADGLKNKDLAGIPWRVALALQAAGWYLRQDIIWHKPNPAPESVGDRCTKAHEYLFLMSKQERYFFDRRAITEAGKSQKSRNKRSVWNVRVRPFRGGHFATFPPELIEPCIRAGSRPGDTVLDPFMGSGTTGVVAQQLDRKWLGIELNPEFCLLAHDRLALQGNRGMSLLEFP